MSNPMIERRRSRRWIGNPTILSYWITDDPFVTREEVINELESIGGNWWNVFSALSGIEVYAKWRGEGLMRGVDVRDYAMIGIDRLTEVLEGGRRHEDAIQLGNEVMARRAALLGQVEQEEDNFIAAERAERDRNSVEYRLATDYIQNMYWDIRNNYWTQFYLVYDEHGRPVRRQTWDDIFPPL